MQTDERFGSVIRLGVLLIGLSALTSGVQAQLEASAAAGQPAAIAAPPYLDNVPGPFRRVASFPVFLNTDVDLETVAEIVTSAQDGKLLIYTDSATRSLGFIDITDPSSPQPAGSLALAGEPTSVAAAGRFALVGVNTSPDFVNPSGQLDVVDLNTRTIVASLDLGGQPDSVAISPNSRYAAVAIENERDEDLGDGEPPQAPPGYVVIVDIMGAPASWTTRTVDLVGIPTLFPEDPEPEYVDINLSNIAVVTLQENNHIVLIDLVDGLVIGDFEAGTVDLSHVDTVENDLIEQDQPLLAVPREPDAVVWTSPMTFATADEGDLFGGSRGFTTWDMFGSTLYQPGNALELGVARLGHYPEGRSENKGCEPESVEFAQYGRERFLFVGSERANVAFVYELAPNPLLGNSNPVLRQVLPTGVAPEGLLAIPERNLFVVACEADSRDDKIRSTVMIYELVGETSYPTVRSEDRNEQGVPIPWGALSGLAVDPVDDQVVYAVHDSFYARNRVFRMDVGQTPAVIDAELELRDANGVLLSALQDLKLQLLGTDDFDPRAIVNLDGSLNIDPEGLAVLTTDDSLAYWVASEGTGNLVNGVSDPDDQPFARPNMLLQVRGDFSSSPFLTVEQVVLPPLDVTLNQLRFGFEGVAVVGDTLYVAFQRAWGAAGDPAGLARIGRYDTQTATWTFAHYPLETPTSPAGGWVGLSELTYLGDDTFALLERDNQGGPDASIKLVTSFSTAGVSFLDSTQVANFELLSKTVVADLIADGAYDFTGGLLPEKQEGLTVLADGTTLIVNDNDGVDDNNGETQLLRLEGLFD